MVVLFTRFVAKYTQAKHVVRSTTIHYTGATWVCGSEMCQFEMTAS